MMHGNRTTTRAGVLGTGYDYALAFLGVLVVGVGGGVWLTGELAGLLFRGVLPHATFVQALDAAVALPSHLGDPRQAWPALARSGMPGLAGFAVASVLVVAALAVVARVLVGWGLARRPERGMASAAQLRATLSEAAVVRRGPVIRPSLAGRRIAVADVGVRIGRAMPAGVPLAVSAEDSALVVAAPRQGKTSQVVIPWL